MCYLLSPGGWLCLPLPFRGYMLISTNANYLCPSVGEYWAVCLLPGEVHKGENELLRTERAIDKMEISLWMPRFAFTTNCSLNVCIMHCMLGLSWPYISQTTLPLLITGFIFITSKQHWPQVASANFKALVWTSCSRVSSSISSSKCWWDEIFAFHEISRSVSRVVTCLTGKVI